MVCDCSWLLMVVNLVRFHIPKRNSFSNPKMNLLLLIVELNVLIQCVFCGKENPHLILELHNAQRCQTKSGLSIVKWNEADKDNAETLAKACSYPDDDSNVNLRFLPGKYSKMDEAINGWLGSEGTRKKIIDKATTGVGCASTYCKQITLPGSKSSSEESTTKKTTKAPDEGEDISKKKRAEKTVPPSPGTLHVCSYSKNGKGGDDLGVTCAKIMKTHKAGAKKNKKQQHKDDKTQIVDTADLENRELILEHHNAIRCQMKVGIVKWRKKSVEKAMKLAKKCKFNANDPSSNFGISRGHSDESFRTDQVLYRWTTTAKSRKKMVGMKIRGVGCAVHYCKVIKGLRGKALIRGWLRVCSYSQKTDGDAMGQNCPSIMQLHNLMDPDNLKGRYKKRQFGGDRAEAKTAQRASKASHVQPWAGTLLISLLAAHAMYRRW